MSYSSDQMGRRFLIQGGLPYNTRTKKIDLGIVFAEDSPFLAAVKNYIIIEKEDNTVELIPEPEEDDNEDGTIPLYQRKELDRKQRIIERAKKRGRI